MAPLYYERKNEDFWQVMRHGLADDLKDWYFETRHTTLEISLGIFILCNLFVDPIRDPATCCITYRYRYTSVYP